jgi:very-short-patch-repair endonuclease
MYVYNDSILKERRQALRKNQTRAEKILWSRLRNRNLSGCKFFRQYSVGPYILDFFCPSARLAIELDGSHHAQEELKRYDEERSDYLNAHNIRVIRFQNHQITQEIEESLNQIATQLALQTPS